MRDFQRTKASLSITSSFCLGGIMRSLVSKRLSCSDKFVFRRKGVCLFYYVCAPLRGSLRDRDRARLYQAMADLATNQASLAQAQAGYYSRLEEVDKRQDELSRRQREIVEILKLLTKERNE